jgi:hypothetical protein
MDRPRTLGSPNLSQEASISSELRSHQSFADMLRRQATPGTAVWLRGPGTSTLRGRSVAHVAQHAAVSEARLYKREQRRKSSDTGEIEGHPRKFTAPGRASLLGTAVRKTSAVFNFIQPFSGYERRLLSLRAAIARRPDRVSTLFIQFAS